MSVFLLRNGSPHFETASLRFFAGVAEISDQLVPPGVPLLNLSPHSARSHQSPRQSSSFVGVLCEMANFWPEICKTAEICKTLQKTLARPIFMQSDDIRSQLPEDSKRFEMLDNSWKETSQNTLTATQSDISYDHATWYCASYLVPSDSFLCQKNRSPFFRLTFSSWHGRFTRT